MSNPAFDDYVKGFLLDAERRGLIDAAARFRLLHLLEWHSRRSDRPAPIEVETTVPERKRPAPTAGPRLAPEVPPPTRASTTPGAVPAAAPAPAGAGGTSPAPAQRQATPPAFRAPVRKAWAGLQSTFALHGLAYLGVLLIFVGTLGLVLFAFGGVNTALRPVAEVLLPTTLFGSASFLKGREATFVAKALELLGGAVLPVVLLTSLNDGADLPPDLGRSGLVLAATLSCLLLAGVYAWAARTARVPALGYLVLPLIWVSIGSAALALRDGPSAAQMTTVTIAVAASGIAIKHLDDPLRRTSEITVAAGLLLSYALTLLFCLAEGWPASPAIASGAAAVVGIFTLERRARERWTLLLAVDAVVAMTLAACSIEWGIAWTGLVAMAAYVVLIELDPPRPLGVEHVAALVGIAIGLALASTEPTTSLFAWAGASVWVHGARLRRFELPVEYLTAAAVVVPAGFAVSLLRIASLGTTLVVTSSIVAGTAFAARFLLVRDPFYRWWIPGAAAVVLVWNIAAAPFAPPKQLLLSGLATTAAFLLSTLPAKRRVAASSLSAGWCLALGLEVLEVAASGRALVWASVSLAGALVTRTLPRHPHLRDIGARRALVASIVSLVFAVGDPRTRLVCLVAAVAVPAIVARVDRHPLLVWYGWTLSLPLLFDAVRYAGIDGPSPQDLLLVWSLVLLLVGAERAHRGARPRPGAWGFDWALTSPPLLLGTVGTAAGLADIYSRSSDTVFGRWSLAASCVVLVGALRLAEPLVSTISYALATAGLVALSPWAPAEEPWLLALWAGVLVGLSFGLELGLKRRPSLVAWALVPFWVSHALALMAIGLAFEARTEAATWTLTGCLALAIWVWQRRWPWAVGGVVLVVGAAAAAGPSWLTIALACVAVLAVLLAERAEGDGALGREAERAWWQCLFVAAAGGSWVSGLVWAGATPQTSLQATALASGTIVVAIGVASRWIRLRRDWSAAGAALASIGLLVSASWALALPPQRPPMLAVAVGTALAALGAGCAARPFELHGLRYVSVALGYASALLLAYRYGWSARQLTIVATVAGLSLASGSLVLFVKNPSSPWLAPAAFAAGFVSATSVAGALAEWPQRDLLIGTLLALGVEAGVAGLTVRSPGLLALSPLALLAAWLLYASQALAGEPMWLTVPSGMAVLALVETSRWDPRGSGRNSSRQLIVLEHLGITLLVGPPLLQAVATTVAYGLLATCLSLAIVAWAAMTRFRRRLVAGAAGTLLSLFVMVAVPVADLLPDVRGPALWLTLAGIGAVFLATAVGLERGRARLASAARSIDALMEGWE